MKAKLIWSFGVSLVTGKNIGKYGEIIKQKSETKINASVTRGTKGNLVPKPEFGNEIAISGNYQAKIRDEN